VDNSQLRYYSDSAKAKDPLDMVERDRRFTLDRYSDLDDQSKYYGNDEDQQLRYYRGVADNQFGNILNNNGGGYMPEDKDRLREFDGDFNNLDLREDEYGDPYYDETVGRNIMGDVHAGEEYFQPGEERDRMNLGFNRRRDVNKAGEEEYANAYEPNRLRRSDAYASSIGEALEEQDAGLGEATRRDRLALSPDFLDRYEMGDDEKQRLVTTAGQDVGQLYQSEIDQAERKASAAGLSPEGQTAVRGRLQRDQAVKSADALTRARIQADQAQADRLRTGEGMRLDAERGYSGAIMDAAGQRVGTKINAQNQAEALRMRGESDVADRNTRRAEFGTANRNAIEEDAADRDYEQTRSISDRGIANARYADQTTSDRAKTIGDNRVAGNMANRDARYQRGLTKLNYQTGREQNFADQRLNDVREARRYYQTQQNPARQDRQFYTGQQGNLYSTAQQGMQNTTQGRMNYDLEKERIKASKPGIFDRIMQGVSAATGVASMAMGGKK
jgi:hypothetical protein